MGYLSIFILYVFSNQQKILKLYNKYFKLLLFFEIIVHLVELFLLIDLLKFRNKYILRSTE